MQQLQSVLWIRVNCLFKNVSIKVYFTEYTSNVIILLECVGLVHNTWTVGQIWLRQLSLHVTDQVLFADSSSLANRHEPTTNTLAFYCLKISRRVVTEISPMNVKNIMGGKCLLKMWMKFKNTGWSQSLSAPYDYSKKVRRNVLISFNHLSWQCS
jgi:hypothetical protein